MTKALVVIPARWGSTRFPGKPLSMIAGRTLLERAIDLGRRSLTGLPDAALMVATDDLRIAAHARNVGCEAVLTEPTITTGSGRALAAARTLDERPIHIVNLQGDAPFMPALAVRAVLLTLADRHADCVTPVMPMSWNDLDTLRSHKAVEPASGTTCVRGPQGQALWFSKQILPMMRDEAALRTAGETCPVLRHLGLYGYSLETLDRFEAAAPSRYERLEGLEQLRLIEMGVRIDTVEIAPPAIAIGGIDTPADATMAERLIAEHGDPFGQ